MQVLITRPQPDAERTGAGLRQRGYEPLLAPLLRIEALPAVPGPGPWDAVLMTSATEARASARQGCSKRLRPLLAFVVGHHTAAVAREAGFLQVASAGGGGGVGDLARLVRLRFATRPARLLYLCGQERSGDLAGELTRSGMSVD